MKKIFLKTAFTLIELILSLTLVSIVMLGIFSINTVLNNNNQDYGQRYLVRSETQTTLNHILNNASLAYGTANANDEGILIGAAVGDANSFCIHQPPGAGNNLINSASDIWLCYSWSNDRINWCAEKYVSGGNDPRGASSCGTAGSNLLSGPTFLGTAYSSFQNLPPTFTPSSGFSITIQNCLNDSAASCFNSNQILQDPVNNPQETVTGGVVPPQVSTG